MNYKYGYIKKTDKLQKRTEMKCDHRIKKKKFCGMYFMIFFKQLLN